MKQETFNKVFKGMGVVGAVGVIGLSYGAWDSYLTLKEKKGQSCKQLADVLRDMHPTLEQQSIFCQNELVRERLGRCMEFTEFCTESGNAKR